MDWKEYKNKFIEEAKRCNRKTEFIHKCLTYAEFLYKNKYPVIFNHKHFSSLVGYSLSYLCAAANSSTKFYRTFTINKKNKTLREIKEPLPSLKEIQHWILYEILENFKLNPYAKAFCKKKSIRENARFHRGQNVIIKLDIENFFPSIKIENVYDIFKQIGYTNAVSTMLSHICCYEYSLPQGAPTSPYLSNIYLDDFDKEIAKYIRRKSIRYTRYADDLTFSGDLDNEQINDLIKTISRLLYKFNLKLNKSKTRVIRNNKRQIVTGIVVNDVLGAPREVRKKLRQEIYYIKKFGLENHMERANIQQANYIRHLLGKANFILSINSHDAEAKEYFRFLKKLLRDSF